jgi:hypothetical protein
MSEREQDLVTDEGVDAGSADMSTEDNGEEAPDLLGVRAAGTPENGEQNAAPELVLTNEQGPGQQSEVGEG